MVLKVKYKGNASSFSYDKSTYNESTVLEFLLLGLKLVSHYDPQIISEQCAQYLLLDRDGEVMDSKTLIESVADNSIFHIYEKKQKIIFFDGYSTMFTADITLGDNGEITSKDLIVAVEKACPGAKVVKFELSDGKSIASGDDMTIKWKDILGIDLHHSTSMPIVSPTFSEIFTVTVITEKGEYTVELDRDSKDHREDIAKAMNISAAELKLLGKRQYGNRFLEIHGSDMIHLFRGQTIAAVKQGQTIVIVNAKDSDILRPFTIDLNESILDIAERVGKTMQPSADFDKSHFKLSLSDTNVQLLSGRAGELLQDGTMLTLLTFEKKLEAPKINNNNNANRLTNAALIGCLAAVATYLLPRSVTYFTGIDASVPKRVIIPTSLLTGVFASCAAYMYQIRSSEPQNQAGK